MAYDGTYLYYNNGAFNGTGTIYKIDPPPVPCSPRPSRPNGINYTGLAYLDGKLYAADLVRRLSIYIFDAALWLPRHHHDDVSGLDLVGLAGDPDRGVLWGVAQGFHGHALRDRSLRPAA